MIYSSQHIPSTREEVAELIAGLARPQTWIILMRSAGHFAGAVFKGFAPYIKCASHLNTFV